MDTMRKQKNSATTYSRLSPSQMGLLLEMELGVTGGEEDGVDNSGVKQEDLYSKPEEIYEVYTALTPIAPKGFSIAAAFGNVNGVYSPGNVKLTPSVREKGLAEG